MGADPAPAPAGLALIATACPEPGEIALLHLRNQAPERPLDDRAIVDAVLAGDRQAFRVLVEREGPAVVRRAPGSSVTAPRPRTWRRRRS